MIGLPSDPGLLFAAALRAEAERVRRFGTGRRTTCAEAWPGERFIPRTSDPQRSQAILNLAAAWHGMPPAVFDFPNYIGRPAGERDDEQDKQQPNDEQPNDEGDNPK